MVIERHYRSDGAPAYVLVFRARDGQPRKFLRLVYPGSHEFERQWGSGTDQLMLPLD